MATDAFSRRVRREVVGRDRRSGLLTGGSFLIAMTLWNVLAPLSSVPIAAFLWCVAAVRGRGLRRVRDRPGLRVVDLVRPGGHAVPPPAVGRTGRRRVGPGRELRHRAGVGPRPEGTSNGARRFRLAGGRSGRSVRVGTRANHAAVTDWPVYALALCRASSPSTGRPRGCATATGWASPSGTGAVTAVHVLVQRLARAGRSARPRWRYRTLRGALLLLLPPTALLAVLQSDRRRAHRSDDRTQRRVRRYE